MVSNLIKRISCIGVYEETSRLDIEKIQVVNLFFFATLPVFIFFSLRNLIKGDYRFSLAYMGCLLISSAVLYLNKERFYSFAKFFSLGFNILLLFSLQYFFGSDLLVESMILVFIVFAAYLINNRVGAVLMVVFISVIFLLLKYHEQFNTPIFAHRILNRTAPTLFISSIVIISFFIFDRRNKTENYIEKQHDYEEELKSKNEELGSQKELIGKQNIELAQKNDELNQFAYIAAHDLKSPIRSIRSFAQLAKINLDKQDYKNVEKHLGTISTNCVHLYQLIQDLLSYSLLEKDSIEVELVDLNEVFESTKLLVIDKLARSIILDCTQLPVVKVNKLQFKLLFQNLIENGLKYNKASVPRISITTEESCDQYHIIKFTDNGIGIEIEYQEQIFDIFNRLHAADVYEGTGLGLAICRKIMERHNGSISVERSSEQGTTFAIKLPVVGDKIELKTKELQLL